MQYLKLVMELIKLFITVFPYVRHALDLVTEFKENNEDKDLAREKTIGALELLGAGENLARTATEAAVRVIKETEKKGKRIAPHGDEFVEE